MANASRFKDMTATIKIGKKRTQPEMMAASVTTNGTNSDGLPLEKRQKLNEEGQTLASSPKPATENENPANSN